MQTFNDYEINKIAVEIDEEVKEIMSFIMNSSSNAQEISSKINNTPVSYAKDILNRNQRKLILIKNKVGSKDQIYLAYSDAVAATVMFVIGFQVNLALMMTSASDFRSNQNHPDIIRIKNNISEFASIISNLLLLDITPNQRFHITNLQSKITTLEKRLNPSSGCFIATFVYEDYNNLEVIKLRLFRDNVMSKSLFGRNIIKYYYLISPKLIKHFSNNIIFKKLSKLFIQLIVKLIKNGTNK